jgi:hypothetical protein
MTTLLFFIVAHSTSLIPPLFIKYFYQARRVNGHTCVSVTSTKPGEWTVIHVCQLLLPSQESERSYMCVSYFYQARRVNGHTCVSVTSTMPGEWTVIHVRVNGHTCESERSYMWEWTIIHVRVNGHTCESERSYMWEW